MSIFVLQINAPEAVQQYAAICRARARELRAAAASQLQRAARYLALRDEVRRIMQRLASCRCSHIALGICYWPTSPVLLA